MLVRNKIARVATKWQCVQPEYLTISKWIPHNIEMDVLLILTFSKV